MKNRSKINITLMGGLGNQLFQFAAGLYVSRQHGRTVTFSTALLQPPKILKTNKTSIRNLMIQELLELEETQSTSRLRILFLKLLTTSRRKYVAIERDIDTELLDFLDSNSLILIGYFQKLRYVNTVQSELLERFNSSRSFTSLVPKILEQRIAIHVRLGDYSSNEAARSFHGLSDVSYFVEGAKLLINCLNCKRILIVSDEPERARTLLESHFDLAEIQITCNSGSNEFEDLAMLSHSAGLVASNSSFSWWAAWLSTPLGSQVVVPSPWFAEASQAEKYLFNDRWKVLPRRISGKDQ